MQNDFNKIAPVYDFLSRIVFGNAIKNSQHWLLQVVPPGSRVLIIGGGTGWILEAFLNQRNFCTILYLEASEKMLQLSRKQYLYSKKTNYCTVEFRLGTEQNLLPTETFDVVFTGFLLDLFKPQPLDTLMLRLNAALNKNGLWLLADFAPENSTKMWQKLLFKTMVNFFKKVANLQTDEIPELKPHFKKLGLQQLEEKYFYRNLIWSAVYKKQ